MKILPISIHLTSKQYLGVGNVVIGIALATIGGLGLGGLLPHFSVGAAGYVFAWGAGHVTVGLPLIFYRDKGKTLDSTQDTPLPETGTTPPPEEPSLPETVTTPPPEEPSRDDNIEAIARLMFNNDLNNGTLEAGTTFEQVKDDYLDSAIAEVVQSTSYLLHVSPKK